jgi:hypothetical protein
LLYILLFTMAGLKDKKARLSNELMEPANSKTQLKRQKKAVQASDRGPNRNKPGTKWNVYIGKIQKMMSAPAKSVAPVVAQITNVSASVVLDRLKSGMFHSFGDDPVVTVSQVGQAKGEGVLDWLTKKVGQSSLFKDTSSTKPTVGNTQIKASFPTDTKTLYQMNQNAYDNRCTNVGDWKCLSGTKTIQFYLKGNVVIVVVRGTANIQDLLADIKIAIQNVRESARYKEDVATIRSFQAQYPLGQYNYYFTGHSLGGALIDEYLKNGMVTSAISFNPAVQKEFYNSANHHRIYNTQDPLYDLMGRHVPTAEVRPFKGKEPSFFERFLEYVPVVGDASKALKGHSLENYIGGMKRMTPSVVDRPYMRGVGPALYGSGMSGGFSFMDDFLKPVARLAIKGSTLGTVDPDKLMQGKAEFEPGNALPYIMKSGQNLLSAKMGDPSGLIEQGIETAQGSGNPWDRVRQSAIDYQRGLNSTGQGRCRWVDKGSRYPDWQEVCDGGGITALKRINTQGFRPIS